MGWYANLTSQSTMRGTTQLNPLFRLHQASRVSGDYLCIWQTPRYSTSPQYSETYTPLLHHTEYLQLGSRFGSRLTACSKDVADTRRTTRAALMPEASTKLAVGGETSEGKGASRSTFTFQGAHRTDTSGPYLIIKPQSAS